MVARPRYRGRDPRESGAEPSPDPFYRPDQSSPGPRRRWSGIGRIPTPQVKSGGASPATGADEEARIAHGRDDGALVEGEIPSTVRPGFEEPRQVPPRAPGAGRLDAPRIQVERIRDAGGVESILRFKARCGPPSLSQWPVRPRPGVLTGSPPRPRSRSPSDPPSISRSRLGFRVVRELGTIARRAPLVAPIRSRFGPPRPDGDRASPRECSGDAAASAKGSPAGRSPAERTLLSRKARHGGAPPEAASPPRSPLDRAPPAPGSLRPDRGPDDA